MVDKIKVIFVDIDGCLNSFDSVSRRQKLGYANISDWPVFPMVGYLNYIIEQTKAKIVISSSWRYFHHITELKETFRQCNIKGEIIDITSSGFNGNKFVPYAEELFQKAERGYEIAFWLSQNLDKVHRYVILDDCNDMVHLKDYLVQTNPKCGLSEADALRAIKILNNGS
jgi:hypothetical protein